MCAQELKNVTLLRALRLTRALRVLKVSKSLRQIVQTITSSLPGTVNVMVCTIFFMIVYSVMGVQLFHESEEFGRSSFKNFGVGMLTMFQCITGEDWVDIMYAGMVTHPIIGPILFISFYILVNFVLMNVIIGIICANFELQDEEKDKRQREKFSDESEKLVQKAFGNHKTFTEEYGVKKLAISAKNKTVDTLVRTVTTERPQDTISPDNVSDEFRHFVGQGRNARRGVTIATDASGDTPVTSFYAKHGQLEDHELRHVEMLELLYDQMTPENLATSADEKPLEEKTCFFFGRQKEGGQPRLTEMMREQSIWVAKHKNFERLVLAAIIISCILLVFDTPNPKYDHQWLNDTAIFFDMLFLVIFTMEFALNVMAFGFLSHQYMGDPWNIPDFFILFSMWLEFLSVLSFNLRAMRVIRPLRLLKRNKGMKLVLSAIATCIMPVANVLGLWLAFLFVYAILGTNLYAGKFRSCWGAEVGEDTVDVFGRADCVGTLVTEDGSVIEPTWDNFGGRWYNFDNVGLSMVTLFEVASLEGWVDVMNGAMDATERDQKPEENVSPGQCIFFISFIVFGTFILIELLVGVFVDSFYQAKGIGLLTEEQRKWYDLCNLIRAKHPKKVDVEDLVLITAETQNDEPEKDRSFKGRARRWLSHPILMNFFTGCIAANMFLLAATWYDLRDDTSTTPGLDIPVKELYKWLNILFVVIFVFEITLKLSAYPKKFWQRGWNRLDFVLMCFSCLEFVVLLDVLSLQVNNILGALARMFRPLRGIRLLELSPGLRMLVRTFFYSISAIFNVTSITVMFYFMYAVLGVQLYSTLQFGDHVDGHANFGNFQNAISLVFRMSTGENWQGVMHDAAVEAPDCGCVCVKDYEFGMSGANSNGFYDCDPLSNEAQIEHLCGDGVSPLTAAESAVDTCGGYWFALTYYISFFFLGGYCLLALFTAVILDCFSVVNHQDSSAVNIDMMKHFKEVWSRFDPYGTVRLNRSTLVPCAPHVSYASEPTSECDTLHWR